jgi:hypothetical protein
MRNLNKVIKISCAQGENLEEELNKFLTAYRTTPHGTIGKAPDEMLFKRRLRTKIPELVPFDKCDEEVRDRDAVLKQKGKEYADDKENAKYPDLKVNDKVLLQQRKTCKTTTMYEHDPYEIVDVNGSQVTIKSGEGVCYKRNSSHVRKFEESDLPLGNEHIDESEHRRPRLDLPAPACAFLITREGRKH